MTTTPDAPDSQPNAIVMELLSSGSLSNLLRRARRANVALDAGLVCRIALEAASGVAYLHSSNCAPL